MSTVTGQGKGAKGLKVIGVAVTALVIGAWILPSRAQMERRPVGPIHTPAEIASDVDFDGILGVDISFPAAAQDGQYCVAYGLAWGGTPPYTFAIASSQTLGFRERESPVIVPRVLALCTHLVV